MTDHAVAVSAVSKVFNPGKANEVEALADIDLTIDAGEFVTLYQDASTKNGLVAITTEEWPTLSAAIDAALQEITKHQDNL